MEDVVVYECENVACALGSRADHGRFTGGISAEQKNRLTGEPVESLVEGEDFGEGVCPSCGEPGTATDETHESVVGTDPHQELHDAVAARVADPDDKLTTTGAQAALLALIGGDDA